MNSLSPEIVVNRFGLGARPGELALAARDPRAWLERQLGPMSFDAGAGSSQAVLGLLRKRQTGRRAGVPDAIAQDELHAISAMGEAMASDTLAQAIRTDRPVAMRLLDFFSNHFSVSVGPTPMRGLAASMAREAIAPPLGGRFVDMVLAVERHPAMLTYLNNRQSVGPGSMLGLRRSSGLNENLAREILELHTLGVDAGYTQADVRELALAITGWSIRTTAAGSGPGFVFRASAHEPGTRVVLGRRYPQPGMAKGERILRDLAAHPATARRLCLKLAQHFVTDEPSESLVQALSARWVDTDGDIPAVMRALITHPEALATRQRKWKTPREFVVSVMRAADTRPPPGNALLHELRILGQPPLAAGSPAGYKDLASAWDGADALVSRIDWVEQRSVQIGHGDPLAIAQSALGGWLSARTAAAIRGADSRRQGLSLLFMSPEFLRR